MICCVYRHFAADGTLLYVGQSLDPLKRLMAHRKVSPWWKDIVRIEIERHDGRAAAMKAEAAAIEAERPAYNTPPQKPKGQKPGDRKMGEIAQVHRLLTDADLVAFIREQGTATTGEIACRYGWGDRETRLRLLCLKAKGLLRNEYGQYSHTGGGNTLLWEAKA